MRTQWRETSLTKMLDAADAEGYASLTALDVPDHPEIIATLPYVGAFGDYREHVTSCAVCAIEPIGCPEGEALLEVSKVGVIEQHRLAESN